ncbi:MAG: hypothetical protein AB1552_03755 [Nitrospirota bacterium]
MKPVRYWKMEIQQLSISERMFFKDAIRTLLTWDVLKDEYSELALIQKIIESEIRLNNQHPKPGKKWWVTDVNVRMLPQQ